MSSVTSSSVTPIRARSTSEAWDVLWSLIDDPAAGPAAFDDLAGSRPDLWSAATMLAALSRIARDERDGTATRQLRAVADGRVDASVIAVVERLPASTHVLATRVALASAAAHASEVLALTHGVAVVDDVTALLLVYRAGALRRVGMDASADGTVAGVLRSPRRHPAIRAVARDQQNAVYL